MFTSSKHFNAPNDKIHNLSEKLKDTGTLGNKKTIKTIENDASDKIDEEQFNEYLQLGTKLSKRNQITNLHQSKKASNENNYFQTNTQSPSYFPILTGSSTADTNFEIEDDSDIKFISDYLNKIENNKHLTRKASSQNFNNDYDKQTNSVINDDFEELMYQMEQEPSQNDSPLDSVYENFNQTELKLEKSTEKNLKNQDFEININDSSFQSKNDLCNLSLFADSLDIINSMLEVIELVDSMVTQVSKSSLKINNLKPLKESSVPTKIDINKPQESDIFEITKKNLETKNSNKRLTCSPIEMEDKSKKAKILPIEEISIDSNSKSISKLSYLNDSHETDVTNKVEKIFLNLLESSYKNINDILKSTYKLEDLTHDICKFMLNQQIKIIQNEKSNTSKLRWFLLITACFESLDLLFNSNWESMIFFVDCSMDIYDECIKNDLNDVLIQIRQLIRPQSATVEQFKFNDIYSFKTPKINNLCKYLKETKSRTQSSKFLIILKRNNLILVETMRKCVQDTTGLITTFIDMDTAANNKCFNGSDSFIAFNKIHLKEYLQQFTNIILYQSPKIAENLELKHNENMKKICNENHINFIEFEIYTVEASIKQELVIKYPKLKDNESKQLIVSKKFLNNYDLIELFETELNFELIERETNLIAKKFDITKEFLCDVDILIDEFTAIKIYDLNKLNILNEDEMFNEIRSLRLKIDLIYVIFAPANCKEKEDFYQIFTTSKYLNLIKLGNDLNRNSIDFKIKMIFLTDSCHLPEAINQICSKILNQKVSNVKLEHKVSNEEAFLLSLGCLNSYSAQSLLSKFKIIDLLEMNDFESIKNSKILSRKRFDLINKILNYKN